MAAVEHLVHFTRSAPFVIDNGQLTFYDVIEPSIMSRSSVLSCIAEAGGEAQLPDSITVSDFRKWLVAVTCSPSEFQHKSFTDLCTVIKVADAVDDQSVTKWITTASSSLREAIFSPKAGSRKDKIVEGLSGLPAHLQQRILEAAARPSFWSHELAQLLTFFPEHLHSPALSAFLMNRDKMEMCIKDSMPLVANALTSLPSSPPAFQVLQVSDRWSSKLSEEEHGLDAPACLAQVIHHHTGLTSLVLPSWLLGCTSPGLLFSAIGALTSLGNLQFDASGDIPPQHTAQLKQTLASLPQLKRLKLHLHDSGFGEAEPVTTCKKRQRGEDELQGQPPSTICLADMLSPATALTSLVLSAKRPESCQDDSSFTAATALALPQLVHLEACFSEYHLAAQFFTHCSAPLTTLELSAGEHPPRSRRGAAPDVSRLLHSLAAFPRLRRLHATLPSDNRDGSASIRILNAMTAALPPLLTALRKLRQCTLEAHTAALLSAGPALAAAAASLTRLRLRCSRARRSSPETTAGADPEWTAFFEGLGALRLRFLEIDIHTDSQPEYYGLALLSTLTQLTSLHVRGWSCLRCAADGEALARMTCLQRLHLHDEEQQLDRECVTALRELRSLVSLKLTDTAEEDGVPHELVARVPPQSLPALYKLHVTMHDPFEDARGLAAYAAAVPALKTLNVDLRPSLNDLEEDGDEPDPQRALRQRASTASECLQTSGVRLVMIAEQLNR